MTDIFSPQSAWLHETLSIGADILVKATALILLAMLLNLLLAQARRVLVRTAVWNALVAGLLILPLATVSFPRLRIHCLPAVTEAPARPEAPAAPAETASDDVPAHRDKMAIDTVMSEGVPFRGGNSAEPLTAGTGFDGPKTTPAPAASTATAESLDAELTPAGSAQTDPAGGASPIFNWLAVLLAVYAAGAALPLLRLVNSLRAVRRLRLSCTPLTDAVWAETLQRWRQRLSIRRPIILASSAHVHVPLAFGWLRPVVLIPANLAAHLDATQRDGILLHELAHIRRNDYLWHVLLKLVQAVYWLHPLVWPVGRWMCAAREQVCDDLCVYHASRSQEYRETLVHVAAGLVRRPAITLSITMARSTRIGQRLQRIDRGHSASHCLVGPAARMTLVSLALAAAAVMGPIQLARRTADAQPPTEDAPPSTRPAGGGLVTVVMDTPGRPEFGPAVRKTLSEHGDVAVDLDTGETFKAEAGVKPKGDVRLIFGQDASVPVGLDITDLAARRINATDWDLPAEQVGRELRDAKVPDRTLPGGLPLVRAWALTGPWPRTVHFKTRQGGIGVLEITRFDAEARSVELRYRLLRDLPKTRPAESDNTSTAASRPATGEAARDRENAPAPRPGEVIELSINADSEGKDCLVDFDTGKLLSPPEKFDGPVPATFAKMGVDAGCTTEPAAPGLWGFQMVVIPVAAEVWDGLMKNREGVERTLIHHLQTGGPTTPAVMSAAGQLPATYLFKTREGATGMVQLREVRHDQRPRHIRIRYKLLGGQRPARPTTQPESARITFDRGEVSRKGTGVESGRYSWEMIRDRPVRLVLGWYSWIDGGVREHAGGGSDLMGTREVDLALEVAVQDDFLLLKRSTTEREADGRGTKAASISQRTPAPPGASLVTFCPQASALTIDRYATLWKGYWIRDGQVVKTEVVVARLAEVNETSGAFDGKEADRAVADTLPEAPALAAALSTGELVFAVIPEDRLPEGTLLFSEEKLTRYRAELTSQGPLPGRQRSDAFQWYEVGWPATGCDLPPASIVADYQGRKYVLLHTRFPMAMSAADEGPLKWKITQASAGRDVQGRPCVEIELDDSGARLLRILSGVNLEEPLAMLVNGRVVTQATIRSELSRQIQISGRFTESQVGNMAAALSSALHAPPATPAVIRPAVQPPMGELLPLDHKTFKPGAGDRAGRGTYGWTLTRKGPSRLIHGWYSIDESGTAEHVGASTGQEPETDMTDLSLEITLEEDYLSLLPSRTDYKGWGDSQRKQTAGVASKTRMPQDAVFSTTALSELEKTVTFYPLGEKYVALWRGEWKRDGRTVKSVAYVARLAGQDDAATGFDAKEFQKALADTGVNPGPTSRPADPSTQPSGATTRPAMEATRLQGQLEFDKPAATTQSAPAAEPFVLRGTVSDDAGKPLKDITLWYSRSQWASRLGTVYTDAQGAFALPKLSAGPVILFVEGPQHLSQTLTDLTMPADGRMEPVHIHLKPKCTLHGIVLGPDATSPVPGAQIGLYVNRRATTADAEGRFVIIRLDPGRRNVLAWADGFALHRQEVEVSCDPGAPEQRIVLSRRGGFLEGRVMDADSGVPMSGQTVIALAMERARTSLEEELDEVDPREFVTRSYRLNNDIYYTAKSDDHGHFRLEHLAAGPYTICLVADRGPLLRADRVMLEEGQATELSPFEVRTQPPGFITGIIRNTYGEPAAGMQVRILYECRNTAGTIMRSLRRTADADGRYHVRMVDVGRQTLRLTSERYAPAERTFNVEKTDQPVTGIDWVLRPAGEADAPGPAAAAEPLPPQPTGAISGRVFLPDGKTPASGIGVMPYTKDRPFPSGHDRSAKDGGTRYYANSKLVTTLQPDGSFTIRGLHAGRYGVLVDPMTRGAAAVARQNPAIWVTLPTLSERFNLSEGEHVRDVRIVMQAGGRVSGVVRNNATGQPIENCWIFLRPRKKQTLFGTAPTTVPFGSEPSSLHTEGGGQFAWNWVYPGDYEMTLTAMDHQPSERVLRVEAGQDLVLPEIRLKLAPPPKVLDFSGPLGSLVGRVLMPDGRTPAAGVRVMPVADVAFPNGGISFGEGPNWTHIGVLHEVISGTDGSFVLKLPPGSYGVYAQPHPNQSERQGLMRDGEFPRPLPALAHTRFVFSRKVEVKADEKSEALQAVLEPAGALAGTVLDASTNKPVGRAGVTLRYSDLRHIPREAHQDYRGLANFGLRAYADEEGRFLLPGLPAGSHYELTIWGMNYADKKLRIGTLKTSATAALEIKLDPANTK